LITQFSNLRPHQILRLFLFFSLHAPKTEPDNSTGGTSNCSKNRAK
jgi:hypothetical protein